MIKTLRCDQPSFRTVAFKPGFNVVLAERTKESTRRDSRNGLGKSTLVEIIHFCLGADAARGKGLLRPQLSGWTFSLEIDLCGKSYILNRNTKTPNVVTIEGDCSSWPTSVRSGMFGTLDVPVAALNTALGWLAFGLPADISSEQYAPAFRSLISYFARRGPSAYRDPFEFFAKQKEWQRQVYNTFLLGLNWEHARNWQILKDKQTTLNQLKRAAQSGLMPEFIGSLGELEIARVRLESQVSQQRRDLESFRVHPQYREIEREADDFTAKIHNLANENVRDQQTISFYEGSFRDERPADSALIEQMYSEAGLVLPDLVIRRLEEVNRFHETIVANRRNFLQSEIRRLGADIDRRSTDVASLSDRRAGLLSILQTHGALEEYTEIQRRYGETLANLQEVENQIETLKRFRQGQSALRIDMEQLLMQAEADYEERSRVRNQAIECFNANSETLYDAPGRLIIDLMPTGFKFDVDIERSESAGIGQMKVFCYDLMLAQLWSMREVAPGFLIHDSTIFADVDERQIAHALQLAARESESGQFQYICCLNSDGIPADDFDDGFSLDKHVVMTLTDDTDSGSLLGIRF